SPNQRMAAAMAKMSSAAAPCNFSQRRCACCQACGCAEVSTGSRAALIRLAAEAASAPITEIAKPASHHSLLTLTSPGTPAPTRPRATGPRHRRNETATGEPREPREECERDLLDDKHSVEHARRHAAGSQRAQHRQPLLEGKADGGIDDEEADKERQQPESGEV